MRGTATVNHSVSRSTAPVGFEQSDALFLHGLAEAALEMDDEEDVQEASPDQMDTSTSSTASSSVEEEQGEQQRLKRKYDQMQRPALRAECERFRIRAAKNNKETRERLVTYRLENEIPATPQPQEPTMTDDDGQVGSVSTVTRRSSSTSTSSQTVSALSTDNSQGNSTSTLAATASEQDSPYSEDELKEKTVQELREILRKWGLKKTGNKSALIGRILGYQENPQAYEGRNPNMS